MIIFLFAINICSAIKISEIELNPAGTDKGNEWIELFSDEKINLGEYKLVNNDGKEILLNSIGDFSGYYVYQLDIQWLDNSDEKVLLYKGDELISQTDVLNDNVNDGKTWSFCEKWEFKESTKNAENNCKSNNEIVKKDNGEEVIEEVNEEVNENKIDDNKNDVVELNNNNNNTETIEIKPIIENKVIYLKPKSIKSENEVLFKSKNEKIKEYAIYAFAIFCVGFIILLIIDKRENARKNV